MRKVEGIQKDKRCNSWSVVVLPEVGKKITKNFKSYEEALKFRLDWEKEANYLPKFLVECDEDYRSLVSYDKDTGEFHSLVRTKLYTRGQLIKIKPDAQGYETLNFFVNGKTKLIKLHRLAWFMHYNTWPEHQIDHINGDRSDNRIENLRDVPQSLNGKNQGLKATNKTGENGIGFGRGKYKKRYVVRLRVNGRNRTFGTYDSLEQAVKVRDSIYKEHDFHENHGTEREKFKW